MRRYKRSCERPKDDCGQDKYRKHWPMAQDIKDLGVEGFPVAIPRSFAEIEIVVLSLSSQLILIRGSINR